MTILYVVVYCERLTYYITVPSFYVFFQYNMMEWIFQNGLPLRITMPPFALNGIPSPNEGRLAHLWLNMIVQHALIDVHAEVETYVKHFNLH